METEMMTVFNIVGFVVTLAALVYVIITGIILFISPLFKSKKGKGHGYYPDE